MSDSIRPVRGPKPDFEAPSYHGVMEFLEGAIGAEFRNHSDDGATPNFLTEEGCYRTMVTSQVHAKLFNKTSGPFFTRAAEIAHFALAEVQAEKLRIGQPLTAPFTPHEQVQVPNPDAFMSLEP